MRRLITITVIHYMYIYHLLLFWVFKKIVCMQTEGCYQRGTNMYLACPYIEFFREVERNRLLWVIFKQ